MVLDLTLAPLDYLRDAAWRTEWEEIYLESVIEEHCPENLRFYQERITDCQEIIGAATRDMHDAAVDIITVPPDDQLQLFLIRRINGYGAAREKKVFYETLLRQAQRDLMSEEARMAETHEKLRITREKRRNLDAEIARRGVPPPPAENGDENVLE
jgi:hypothetical protein